jgi:sulfofructose kinase
VTDQAGLSWDVLYLGGASADLILKLPHLPERGEKTLAKLSGRLPGGFIANAACASARLGLKTAWGGRLGEDESAEVLLNDFQKKGVDSRYTQIVKDAATDFCIILLEPGGERTILVVNTIPGVLSLDASVKEGIAHSRIVYSMPYELAWFQELAACVHAAGAQIAIDMESACPICGNELMQALSHCDLVFTTRKGLQVATGIEDSQEAVQKIIALGVKLVVVTFGAQGARAYTSTDSQFSPAIKVPVVDSTGAGDCFHAAFMSGYLQGWPHEVSLRFASAAAALSVQKLGAREGLPNKDEVEAFLASHLGDLAHER